MIGRERWICSLAVAFKGLVGRFRANSMVEQSQNRELLQSVCSRAAEAPCISGRGPGADIPRRNLALSVAHRQTSIKFSTISKEAIVGIRRRGSHETPAPISPKAKPPAACRTRQAAEAVSRSSKKLRRRARNIVSRRRLSLALQSPVRRGLAGPMPSRCELVHNPGSFFPKWRGLRSAPFHLDPNIFPVFRLIKCNLAQAAQVITSYSFSGMSESSSSQCWTFTDVAGHLKMKGAIPGKCGPILLAVFAPNQSHPSQAW
jgi:hypothetical protein